MIYNGWAFSEDEQKKSEENCTEFQRIKDEGKFIYKNCKHDYNCFTMKIEATRPFTGVEMLLLADNGNLCFGGTFSGADDIYKMMNPGIYTVKIFTD